MITINGDVAFIKGGYGDCVPHIAATDGIEDTIVIFNKPEGWEDTKYSNGGKSIYAGRPISESPSPNVIIQFKDKAAVDSLIEFLGKLFKSDTDGT
jgi:hypothetical protein